MGPGEALAAITLFLAVSGAVVLRGPLGKALADRIAGRHLSARQEDDLAEAVDRNSAELEQMRHRLAELEERQDFTERVLAAHRAPERLEP